MFRLYLLSIDDKALMQMIDGKDDLCAIKFSNLFVKVADATKMKEQLAARAEFKDEVEFALGLESVGQLNDEWMFDVFEDGPLGYGVLHLVLFDQVLLLEGFNCVDMTRVELLGQENFSIGARAYNLHQIEVVDLQTAVLDLHTQRNMSDFD